MTEEREEEAWTEEYFAKQDCGTVVGEEPTYQWILFEHVPYSDGWREPIGTFCKLGYAKLYKKWMEELANADGTGYYYTLSSEVINNPQKPKELQNV
jgi:hypothetical protein